MAMAKIISKNVLTLGLAAAQVPAIGRNGRSRLCPNRAGAKIRLRFGACYEGGPRAG
jgi:hypothetical protein